MITDSLPRSVPRRFASHVLFAALAVFAAPQLPAQTASSTVLATGLSGPSGITVDGLGNIYVGESNGTIRKITPAGVVSTFAYTGSYYPYGMTHDAANNIYVSNYGGSTVSKITPAGVVSTYAQVGSGPIGLGFDANGNLFVAVRGSRTVQKVTPAGAVSQFAVLPDYPVGMAVDKSGTLYVGYTSTYISKVTSAGVVSTFLSSVNYSYGLDISPSGDIVFAETAGTVRKATPAGVTSTVGTGLSFPWGVACDSYGNTYVACYNDGSVRRLGAVGIGVNFSAGSYPVPQLGQPGVVSGTNWNNVAGGSGANIALNDTTGAATTARLSFTAAGAYDGFTPPGTANSATNAMYRAALYGTSTEVAITVTNIPYAYYDVYTYASSADTKQVTLSISNGTTTFYYRDGGQDNSGATSLLQTTSTDAANPTVGRAQYQVFRTQSGPTLTLTTGGSVAGVISNNVFGIHIVPVAAPPLPAPVITSATSASGTYGSAFSYQITASNSPTSFNAAGLPPGLSVNTSSGVISGTPVSTGSFTVNLSATNATGTGSRALSLTIAKASAQVTLGALDHVYDGTTKSATATTSPAGVPVDFSYSGPSLPPRNAGTYGVIATVNSPYYTGSATGSLVIAPASATVTLGNLTQSHDGTPKSVSVTTAPANLAVSVTYDGAATAPTNAGTYAVVAKITDPNYTGTASGTLTIADTTPPVLTLPANLTVEATSGAGAIVTFATSASDAVDGAVAVTTSAASGSTFALGTTTVTATAVDAAGNKATGSFTVTVRDTTAPTLTVPANLTLEATSAAGAVATFSATATDAVSTPTISYSSSSGSTFALGTTTVAVTAVDAAGNKSTGSFTVTVRDTTAPSLTLPANQTLEATSAAGAVATFAVSATDAVSTPTVTASSASGSTFALGTTTVTVTAVDAAGNQATGSFTITVRDTTAPALIVPANQVIEATSAAGAVATFSATATDAVSTPAIAYSIAPGGTFAVGTTTVVVTATDEAGNKATGSFTVTVRDTTAPAIQSLTASTTSLWPANHKLVAVSLNAAATDAVGVSSLKIVSATSNEPDNGLGDGDTAGDIAVTGALTLNLRAERAGTGNGRVYTIVVEARDAAGNASTRAIAITVPKSQGGK